MKMMSVEAGQAESCHKQLQQKYANHYPCWQALIFTIDITAIHIVLFIYYCIGNSVCSGLDSLLESPLIYRNDKRIQQWWFFTYGSLHAGWSHLVFNLLVQVVVGLPFEMVHRSTRVAACIYLAGVVAGSLGTSMFDLTHVYLVGGSGGVYALMVGAYLVIVQVNYSTMQFGFKRLIGMAFIAVADMRFALYDYYTGSQSGSLPVSYIALKRFQDQPDKDHLLSWVSLGSFTACVVFAVTFNLLHPFPY